MTDNDKLLPSERWQTAMRGTDEQAFQNYLDCADDGKGGDITRNGAPLKTFNEWLAS